MKIVSILVLMEKEKKMSNEKKCMQAIKQYAVEYKEYEEKTQTMDAVRGQIDALHDDGSVRECLSKKRR